MRRLIINADDLGINSQRSHGIFMTAEQGVVTSASLMVTTSDSEDAARRASERDLPTGLHFNLTWGAPLSKDGHIGSLLTTDGYFVGRDDLRRRIGEGEVEPEHVEREARAQIEWFLEHRGQPTHVDGHHHIHVHPFIARIIAPILDRYGISFVRIPSEPSVPFGFLIEKSQTDHIAAVSKEADDARKLFAGHGIGSTDHFRGLAFGGNASMRNMRHILSRLPEGTTEWMVHPGSPHPHGEPFDADPQRQTEMAILMSDDTRAELTERGIELCSYGDLF
jgi:chitin disaccharide deacetylase